MLMTRTLLCACGLVAGLATGTPSFAQDMATQPQVVISPTSSTASNHVAAVIRGQLSGRQTVWPGDYHDALDRQQGVYSSDRGGRDPSGGFYGRLMAG